MFKSFVINNNFKQLVKDPTRDDKILDHIYARTSQCVSIADFNEAISDHSGTEIRTKRAVPMKRG